MADVTAEQGPTYSTEHPHEPEIPPAFDDEGRCLICVMLVRIENLEAELQAAQEREKVLREALRRTVDELAEAAAHIGRARLAAQRPSEQRFTEKGAECRNTHVKGYTGPICSCPPLNCYAVERTEEPSERHNPWDAACSRHLQGEPTRADARCLICRPEEPSDG